MKTSTTATTSVENLSTSNNSSTGMHTCMYSEDQYFNNNIVSEAAMSAELTAGISAGGVAFIVILAALVFCTLRKHKKKNQTEAEGDVDANPVYGLYECDPDPQAEVEDTNDYYDSMYEEGTAVTRDNNSMYESR